MSNSGITIQNIVELLILGSSQNVKKKRTEIVVVFSKRIHQILSDLQPSEVEKHLEGSENREKNCNFL